MPNFNITRRETDFCGRKLIVETGKMAKQANGSVFIQYGETAVLVTATMSKEAAEDQDFFPLTVDYIEKMYAAGKIPSGFFKRESKPSTDATLMARVIDRSIRPLFPEGFRNQVHIVVTVLSFDGVTDPSTMGVFGASLALSISDIPFNGPIASVTVGYIDDQFVVNPHFNEIETKSKLNLTVAGSESSIVMIESAASELSEEIMLDAVFTGHKEIQKLCTLQQDFISTCGKEKVEVVLDSIPEEIMSKVENAFGAKIAEAAVIFGKQERQDAFDTAEAEMVEMFSKQEDTDLSPWEEKERYYKMAFDELIRRYVRDSI